MGECGGGWSILDEGKKAALLLKRWQAKKEKEAADDAQLEREEAEPPRRLRRLRRLRSRPRRSRRRRTPPPVAELEGVRDVITADTLPELGVTVVKSAEVNRWRELQLGMYADHPMAVDCAGESCGSGVNKTKRIKKFIQPTTARIKPASKKADKHHKIKN